MPSWLRSMKSWPCRWACWAMYRPNCARSSGAMRAKAAWAARRWSSAESWGGNLPITVRSLLLGDRLRSLLVAVEEVLDVALQPAGEVIAGFHVSLASCLVSSRFYLIREDRLDGFNRLARSLAHHRTQRSWAWLSY